MTGSGPCAAWLTLALAGALAGCQRDPELRGGLAPGGDGHRLHSTSGPSAMTITADLLRTWSEQLCTLPALDLAAALPALGIAGALAARSEDYATVEPPPAGATRLALTRENLGQNKGQLGTLEVTPAGTSITRGELDRRFGAGEAGARVDHDRPHVVTYRVERPDAPFRCTVFASFADEPGAASVATQINLRRDVVRKPR